MYAIQKIESERVGANLVGRLCTCAGGGGGGLGWAGQVG